jgi:type III pantothenate kinase
MNRIPPAQAVLAIDVGNTRIALMVSRGDQINAAVHVDGAQPASWRPALELQWGEVNGASQPAIAVCSVHPQRARAFADLALDVTKIEPLLVGADLPLPLKLDLRNKREVGPDRVCAAAAAYDKLRAACAVASFGTATTIDCVSADGVFLGGAILPGVEMSCDALHERTAKLPRIEPAKPESAFGKTTYDAIAAGVLLGQVGALREIVERFAAELKQWPHLVLTGGSAPLLTELIDFADSYVPDLCLRGIALAYRKAAESSASN